MNKREIISSQFDIYTLDSMHPALYALICNNPELFPEDQNLIAKAAEELLLLRLPKHTLAE